MRHFRPGALIKVAASVSVPFSEVQQTPLLQPLEGIPLSSVLG